MAVKSKITFVVPESLQSEMRESVIKQGYGLRGKSIWICEAIEALLKLNNYPELVNYSSELKGFEKAETVVMPREFKKQMDNAAMEVRKHYPLLEGVQSSLVRTAIMQRLLR